MVSKSIFRNFIPIFLLLNSLFSSAQQRIPSIEVYFFLQPDCPISQQYTPIINAFFTKEKSTSDITRISLVFSTSEGNQFEKSVKGFISKYGMEMPYRIDKNYAFAKKLQATITPEVFVLVDGMIKYHGAIDNMYARLGVKRAETTEFYLQEAISAIRNGLTPPYAFKEPLGCFIEY